MMCPIANAVQAVSTLMWLAILGRVIYSWIDPSPFPTNTVKRVLWRLTDPILDPVRRFMPAIGTIDLSPIVAMVLIQLVAGAIATGLGGEFCGPM
ncbi:MAG: YggT family protein [Ardenticatenales bacterium]